MHILLLTQYYKPEDVGPAIWIDEMVADLTAMGHEISVLTSFPNYPRGEIFEGYRGKLFQREVLDDISLTRTWIYATHSKSFLSRTLNFGSFSFSAVLGGIFAAKRPDLIYVLMPPLTLGVTGAILALVKRTRLVVNIQDIHPYAAVALGVLRNKRAIRFFEAMEKWIYRRADHIVVISKGFKENLQSKGVPETKLSVVSNWADPDFFSLGDKDNDFREDLHANGKFVLVYSGGLTHNSNLEPVIGAAEILHDKPIQFVIVGEGVRKPALENLVAKKELKNVQFLPFQPLERYPEVLRAADMSLVTLNQQASLVSVPSKIFKQMAIGRPILAITAHDTELDRLVTDAQCGRTVKPDDPLGLADVLSWALENPHDLEQMGRNARNYFEQHLSRDICTKQLEEIFLHTLGQEQITEL